jgi:hypothetical protein
VGFGVPIARKTDGVRPRVGLAINAAGFTERHFRLTPDSYESVSYLQLFLRKEAD